MLATLGHAVGWPIPVGGSQAIPDALLDDLRAHGGEIVLGEEVTRRPGGVVLYDTAPTALLRIYGDALPPRYAKALRRYRFGPGVAKVDFVLSGEIPWRDARLALAPTLHLGGTRAQMALAEAEIAKGRHADWPMVLAALTAPRRPGAHRRGGPSTAVDLRARARGVHGRHGRRGDRGVRALRAGIPRPRGRRAQRARRTSGGSQRQPGRWRHRRRRQQHVQRAHRPDAAAQPVVDADPQGLPVLVGDAARRWRARDGRLLRRPHGAASRVRHQEVPNLSP